jgi:hypothetical protein
MFCNGRLSHPQKFLTGRISILLGAFISLPILRR